MRRRTEFLFPFFLAFACSLANVVPLWGQQPADASDICVRVELASVSSVTAPTWIAERSQLLVTDWHKENRTAVLLANGRRAGFFDQKLLSLASTPPPFGRVETEDGFLELRYGTGDDGFPQVEITWLDSSLRRQGMVPLFDPDSDVRVFSLLDWTVAGDHLVGFGGYSLDVAAEHFATGVFYHRLHRPQSGLRGSIGLLIPMMEEAFYEGPERYFTSIGSTAYFLHMEPGKFPKLFRFSPDEGEVEPTLLTSFPGIGRENPDLGWEVSTMEEYRDVRQSRLSQADFVPRGLHSQGELLYALYSDRQEGWQLEQLVPEPDIGSFSALGTMRIPSGASSISLLSTPDRWFVFEHPGADGEPVTMLVLPQENVTNSFRSPLYGPGKRSIRCAAG